MRHIESENQTAFATWFKYQYPKYVDNLNASLVGANVGVRAGKLAKDMGVCKGWPDITLAVPNVFYSGLFIEMKSVIDGKKGKVSEDQKRVHLALYRAGYRVVVCYNADQARETVKEYMRYLKPEVSENPV